jgi:hypothetical protein
MSTSVRQNRVLSTRSDTTCLYKIGNDIVGLEVLVGLGVLKKIHVTCNFLAHESRLGMPMVDAVIYEQTALLCIVKKA